MPVSMPFRSNGEYLPSSFLWNWMNTRFHISMNLPQSQSRPQSGLPHPYFGPRSMCISEHGPHGPTPISQKLSSLPLRTILEASTLIFLFQISKASSSSRYGYPLLFGEAQMLGDELQAQAMASSLK